MSEILSRVQDTAPREVFRALATALGVPLSIDMTLSDEPTSFRLSNTATIDALNLLCALNQCQWTFDPDRGLRLLAKP